MCKSIRKRSLHIVFLRITEVVEVTQEINSTGIIPLEALRAHLPKRPHNYTFVIWMSLTIYLKNKIRHIHLFFLSGIQHQMSQQ